MSRRWRLLIIGGAVLAGLLLLCVAALLLFYGRVGEWAIRTKVLPKVERKLGREVAIGGIHVTRGQVVLQDIEIRGPGDDDEPLAAIPRVVVDFDFWASLKGDIDVHRVVVQDMRALLLRTSEGDNFRDLLERLTRNDDQAGAGGGGLSLRPDLLRLEGGRVELRDRVGRITIIGEGVAGVLEAGGAATAEIDSLAALTGFGPYASLEGILVTTHMDDPVGRAVAEVQGGEVKLWNGMTLTGIAGSVAQGEEAGQLWLDLEGGYGGAEGTLWKAKGWVDPRKQIGHVRVKADRFTFDRISSVLKDSVVIDYDDTSIDAELVLEVGTDRIEFRGDLNLNGLSVEHPMLASQPVRGVNFAGHVDATYDRHARSATLKQASLEVGGVKYDLEGRLDLPGGVNLETGLGRDHPRLSARLVIPPVPCQQMLDSIPKGFIPRLDGFALKGTFATELAVGIDWADLDATTLDGSVGIKGCRVRSAPGSLSAARLRDSFEHRVLIARDTWETITIGPENPDFVPVAAVSPYFIKSLVTTEDSRFYRHRGFITKEFRTALVKDLKAGYFKYGASSITMQMVKNVFLQREKTLSRKFQELFLTWYVETRMNKDRIMEIYVNAIEYGPRLYGIKPAARIYFDKHPRDLTPVEAAFFSSILPAPKRRYRQFCRDKLSGWTERKIERILGLMLKRQRITEEEYDMALVTPLVFGPSKSALCSRRRRSGR